MPKTLPFAFSTAMPALATIHGNPAKPFAIYHEHPDWFRPVFKELDRRGLPYVRLDPRRHWYDPARDRAIIRSCSIA